MNVPRINIIQKKQVDKMFIMFSPKKGVMFSSPAKKGTFIVNPDMVQWKMA